MSMERLIREANRRAQPGSGGGVDWLYADGFWFHGPARKAYLGNTDPANEVPWNDAIEASPIMSALRANAGAKR